MFILTMMACRVIGRISTRHQSLLRKKTVSMYIGAENETRNEAQIPRILLAARIEFIISRMFDLARYVYLMSVLTCLVLGAWDVNALLAILKD